MTGSATLVPHTKTIAASRIAAQEGINQMPEQLTLEEIELSAPVKPRPYRLAVDVILADVPTSRVARIMKVSDRTVQRWRKKGVDGWVGDKIAVKVMGLDPYTVWGSDFDLAFEAA